MSLNARSCQLDSSRLCDACHCRLFRALLSLGHQFKMAWFWTLAEGDHTCFAVIAESSPGTHWAEAIARAVIARCAWRCERRKRSTTGSNWGTHACHAESGRQDRLRCRAKGEGAADEEAGRTGKLSRSAKSDDPGSMKPPAASFPR